MREGRWLDAGGKMVGQGREDGGKEMNKEEGGTKENIGDKW